MHRKMNVIAKISCYFERSVVTLKLRKEYLNIVIHNISVLLWIKKLNSVIYRTLFYVNIYESYKLLKTVRFFGPPCSFVGNLSLFAAAKELCILIKIDKVIAMVTWLTFLTHGVYNSAYSN